MTHEESVVQPDARDQQQGRDVERGEGDAQERQDRGGQQ
jgi:hypothetical protein